MKGGMHLRPGGFGGLGENRGTETFGDGGCYQAIVPPCLTSEPEESEEDECAKDGSPPSGFKRASDNRVSVYHNPGELKDTRVSPVGVIPGDPGANLAPIGVVDDGPNCQRNGEAEIKGS